MKFIVKKITTEIISKFNKQKVVSKNKNQFNISTKNKLKASVPSKNIKFEFIPKKIISVIYSKQIDVKIVRTKTT
tara:strand:+ start:188 stop:412 length:225 start_codon:yes stop_codon:yes gene_type:complete